MASWVRNLVFDQSEIKEETKKETPSQGGVFSYFSGLLSPSSETPVDSRGTDLENSWEKVTMADLEGKAVISQPKSELSLTDSYAEAKQQICDLKKVDDLEGVVQTHGIEMNQIKEQHKTKRGLHLLRKQPSKDKDSGCAKEIREKDSEIRDKEEQIEFFRKKLDNAEELEKQNLQLATELSDKERKLEDLSKQFIHLQEEMKVKMNQNRQITDAEKGYQDEIKQLKAEINNLHEQLHSEPHVEVMVVGDEGHGEQKSLSEEKQIVKHQSRVIALQADLEKASLHLKAQSREILSLKQELYCTKLENEEQMKSSHSLLQESEDRVALLQKEVQNVRAERKKLDDKLLELEQSHRADIKRIELLEAQLDDDSTKCPKAGCIRSRRDYETLANENVRLQKSIVDLSGISDENQQHSQKIVELRQTIQDLNERLEATTLQVESHKSDFEEERRDREAAHSKLADLEKAIGVSEFQEGSAKNIMSYAELKKQKIKLEEELKASLVSLGKLQEDLIKSKGESTRLREEMKAKVSQVRQYKKENDRLKAQLDQSTKSMIMLSDEMEEIQKKAKSKKKTHKKAKLPPDPNMSLEKRIASMETLCDQFQTENLELRVHSEQLEDEVNHLRKINQELKKFLKQNPYGGTSQHGVPPLQISSAVSPIEDTCNSTILGETYSDPSQTIHSLETDPQTAGTGELHRQIPDQLEIPLKDKSSHICHSDLKITSAPLCSRVSEVKQQHKPPQTVLVQAHDTRPSVTQQGRLAVTPTVQAVHSGQLGSPLYSPSEPQPKALYDHHQGVHTSDQGKTYSRQLGHLQGVVQPRDPRAATSPDRFLSPERDIAEQPSPSALPPSDPTQAFSSKTYPNYNQRNYVAEDYPHRPASNVAHGGNYQRVTSTSGPQYQPQYQSSVQPQQQSQPQLNRQSQPPPQHGSACVAETISQKQIPESHLQGQPAFVNPPPTSEAITTVPNSDQDDQDLQFQNPLQNEVDEDIHREASEVIKQVGGSRRYIVTDRQRPFDPNLVCPMCMKQFRIGEIQKFKHHVNTCDGTDDTMI